MNQQVMPTALLSDPYTVMAGLDLIGANLATRWSYVRCSGATKFTSSPRQSSRHPREGGDPELAFMGHAHAAACSVVGFPLRYCIESPILYITIPEIPIDTIPRSVFSSRNVHRGHRS
jgi:hypothetical protein